MPIVLGILAILYFYNYLKKFHLKRTLKLQLAFSHLVRTVNVDFLRIEYMVLAKYQHMSILELILLVKQHILILCKNLLGVDVLIIVN